MENQVRTCREVSHLVPPHVMSPGSIVVGTDFQSGGTVPLTDIQCRKAQLPEKDYSLADFTARYPEIGPEVLAP